MHLGFALDSSDIDLRDIDLSDTDLDLLDTDIPSKHFVGFKTCHQDVFKTPSRRLQDQQMFVGLQVSHIF